MYILLIEFSYQHIDPHNNTIINRSGPGRLLESNMAHLVIPNRYVLPGSINGQAIPSL
jgi:hypothetical protein